MRHYRIYVRLKSGGQATARQSRPSLRYTRMKSKRTFVGGVLRHRRVLYVPFRECGFAGRASLMQSALLADF